MVETDSERWRRYFSVTHDRPPHPLLDLLDEWLPASGDAIDLGCGAGRGTLRLLERGLRVTATDAEEAAVEAVRARVPADAPLTLVQAPFQELQLGTYDVACAVCSLFFMPPSDFRAFWARLVRAIKPNGLFAGQFLGVKDTWAERGYTVLSRTEVEALFDGFEILHLAEEDYDGSDALDEPKHWHVLHVIARKD